MGSFDNLIQPVKLVIVKRNEVITREDSHYYVHCLMTVVVAEIINLVLDHISVVADGSREELMYHPRHYLPRSCYSGHDRKMRDTR